MQRDRLHLYLISCIHATALLPVLFLRSSSARSVIAAALMILAATLAVLFIKKRGVPHIRYREATLVCTLAAACGVVLLYLTGLRFGFYGIRFSGDLLTTRILPLLFAVISGEILRRILLVQRRQLVSIVSYLAFVLSDFALLSETANPFLSLSAFMTAFGSVLLPALTANLLCHYLSSTHGVRATLPYRLITLLYPYVFLTGVKMPSAMLSFVKILFPLLVLWFLHALYERRKMAVSRRNTAVQVVSTLLTVAIMVAVVAFVSGAFGYKLIVIVSPSMQGSINVGDAVIYESYDGEILEEDQIILFRKQNTTIVHRIIEVKKINGVYRYYTKGDANDGPDTGYITSADIIGVAKTNVPYLGYPTVWMHELFK